MGHRIQSGSGLGTQEGEGHEGSLDHPLVEPLTASRFADAVLQSLPCLRAVARKLTPVPADAADLVQATVLRALEKQDRFTFVSDAGFRGWLVAIMQNIQCDLVRKRRREVLKGTLYELPRPLG